MAFRGIQSTNIISTEVGITDPLLILNKDGSTAVDVGFLGKIGSNAYTGLVKDSTTEDFLLIKSINLASSSVNSIDATDLSLVKGDLVVDTVTGDLIGDVTGQVSDISNFNTDSLSEGSTNLYYTDARANSAWDTKFASADTDSLSEGSSNLYYTNARADARAQLKIDALVDSSPGTLDTLNELAAALGDDANFSTTVTNSIATKLPLAGGTLTGDLSVSANVYLTAGVDARIQLGTSGSGANSDSDNSVYVRGNDDHLILGAAGNGSISLKENADTRMYIATGGNTGIGATTNLTSKLTVNAPAASHTTGYQEDIAQFYTTASSYLGRHYLNMFHDNNNRDSSGDHTVWGMGFGYDGNTRGGIQYDHKGQERLTLWSSYGDIQIKGNSSGSAGLRADQVDTTIMTLQGNGKVGIGTDNPGAKLSVSGLAALANLGGGSTGSAALYVNSTSGHVGELIQVLKNGTTKMHMANDGKLGLGTSSPTEVLHVVGSILATADITAYSDDSLKTNVQVIDNAVGKVEQLRGVTFDRIEDGSTSTGVIAQELKEVLPEAVHTDEQGVHSVAYGNVVGLLIEAIKEQQKQIDELIKANKS